jgi:hypothetical protein
MFRTVPYLPLNPLLPRAFGGKGAEGLKKEILAAPLPGVAGERH